MLPDLQSSYSIRCDVGAVGVAVLAPVLPGVRVVLPEVVQPRPGRHGADALLRQVDAGVLAEPPAQFHLLHLLDRGVRAGHVVGRAVVPQPDVVGQLVEHRVAGLHERLVQAHQALVRVAVVGVRATVDRHRRRAARTARSASSRPRPRRRSRSPSRSIPERTGPGSRGSESARSCRSRTAPELAARRSRRSRCSGCRSGSWPSRRSGRWWSSRRPRRSWRRCCPRPGSCGWRSASAFCASCCTCALMLVTRSSPAFASVWLTVPVTWPAALTDTTLSPMVPRSCWSYWPSQAGLADQVHAGEPGLRQAALLHLLRGDRLQVPEHLGHGGGTPAGRTG